MNWNGKHYLEKFLDNVKAYTENEDTRVIIADNGSTDGSCEWLEQNHPDTRIIRLDRNYGFTGGYNRAIAQIDAPYCILLNSDVEVTKDWIKPMLHYMETHPECAATMPKVLSYGKREDFEYAGACGGYIDMFGYPFCRGRILSKIETDKGQYDSVREIFWASGVALMIRTSLYKELGGLDEAFFAHMEEIDLCWRIKHLGYSIAVIPSSVIYHVGGGTLPNNSPRKLYLNYRNNLLMMYKNLPPSERHIILFVRKVLDGMSAMVYLIQGNAAFFGSVLKAHRDYYRMKSKVTRTKTTARYNRKGIYRGSIVFKFFAGRQSLRFDQIKNLL